MPSDADLNNVADALDYDGIVFHAGDPDGDPAVNVAAGTDSSYAITAGDPGAAGPYPTSNPAVPGRVYWSPAVVAPTERVTHVSLLAGGVWRRTFALTRPFGPVGASPFPFVYAAQVEQAEA